MSYGLALSGGGARGAAHAGVLLALKEEHLLPDFIGGTSAGSIAAGLFAAGLEPEELCALVSTLSIHGSDYLDLNLFSLLTLIPQMLLHSPIRICGLLKGKRLHTLLNSLTNGARLEALTFPLLIPAVDLKRGATVCFTNFPGIKPTKTGRPGKDPEIFWRSSGSLSALILASSSVPGIFCPVHLDSFCLVDGGVTNNLPVSLMQEAGCQQILAVDIGSPYQMPEQESIFEILSHSFSIMSTNLKDCRSLGETFLLTPPLPKEAGLFSFEKMETCMEEGYRYTKQNLGAFSKLINTDSSI